MASGSEPRELLRLSRRQFAVRAVVLGFSASAVARFLAACGGASPTATSAPAGSAGAATTAAGAAATSPAATAAPVTGGELRLASTTEGISMHPFKLTDTPSFSYIDRMFYMPLLRYDQDTLELTPFVAAGVKTSEDHTLVTFTLRDNLQWSDGQSLTATDYAWTWSKASDKSNAWPRLGAYAGVIDSVKDVDAKTLEVKLKGALAISLEKASAALAYVLPRHLWENLDWNDPNKNPEIMKPTVVAGPYKLLEWRKDEYASFVANEKFFLGRPHIDKITQRIFGNTNVATQALMNGEIDQYAPEPENWPDLQEHPKLTALQWDTPSAAVTYIGLDLRQEPLKEKAVRQALNYALDKEAITAKLTYGLGRRATQMNVPSSWAYDPSVTPYKYDPATAKGLLDAAGWKPGAGGIREKNGQPLKLLLLYGPNTAPVREQIATITQQQWRAVGADVEVRGMEFGALLKVTKEGPYDWGAYVNAYIAAIDPDSLAVWWRQDPAFNRVDYHNPRVAELYAQGLRELDREKRKPIYQEIDRILTDDSPWIWLFYQQGYTAMNKRVKGVRVTKALGLNDYWEWWIQP